MNLGTLYIFHLLIEKTDEIFRDRRKGRSEDEEIPCILESEGSSKGYRENWARLIQKIQEEAPLTWPKCQRKMKIIRFVQDEEVIEKILKDLVL